MISVVDIDVPRTYVRLANTRANPALVHDEIVDTVGTLDREVPFQIVMSSPEFSARTVLNSLETIYGRPASDLFYTRDEEVKESTFQFDAYYPQSNEGEFKSYAVSLFGDDRNWQRDLETNLSATYFPSIDASHVVDDTEEVLSRGIQPVIHDYKVLFSTEVEIDGLALKRWKPSSFAQTDFDYDD